MSLRIGLDVDDVLFPWSQHAHAACLEAGVTNGFEIDRWDFEQSYGITRSRLWEVLFAAYEDGMLTDHPPYDGVEDILGAFQDEHGHSVHLVTARGFEGPLAAQVRADTADWLEFYNIPHDSLTFTRDKTLVKVDAFLDDSPANVEAMVEQGVFSCLRDQAHNRYDWGNWAPRVESLEHFAVLAEPKMAEWLARFAARA